MARSSATTTLLDVDAAVNLMREFDEPTFAILKHNNACGVASRECLTDAYKDALAGDPISAFGGIFIANETIDLETAEAINERFCEVIVAPFIAPQALEVLKSKKNRIVLMWKEAGAAEEAVSQGPERGAGTGLRYVNRPQGGYGARYEGGSDRGAAGRSGVCVQDLQTHEIKCHRAGKGPAIAGERYRTSESG